MNELEKLKSINKILTSRVEYQQDIIEYTRDTLIILEQELAEMIKDKCNIDGNYIFTILGEMLNNLRR